MIIFSKVVLLPMLYLFAVSCTDRLSTNIGQVGQQTEKCTVGVRLQQEGIGVKSKDPGDENKISDINLFVPRYKRALNKCKESESITLRKKANEILDLYKEDFDLVKD